MSCATNCCPAPMVHSYRQELVTWRYQVRIPVGSDICHRDCGYTVLQTVQRPGVFSAAHGTVHYEKSVKSFEIRVGHIPGFGLLFVAKFHDCAESDVKQYSLIHATNCHSPWTRYEPPPPPPGPIFANTYLWTSIQYLLACTQNIKT